MFARPFASRNGSTYPHVTTPFTTYFEPSGKSASARNMPRSSGGSGETTRSNASGRRLASRSCKIVTVRLTRLNFTNCQSVRPFPAERRSSSRFHAFTAKRSLPFALCKIILNKFDWVIWQGLSTLFELSDAYCLSDFLLP